jgi:hypothetical protein
MDSGTAGVLLIVGSAVFFLGAAIGVPRVFTEPDRRRKLEMLEERLLLWRVAQPLYALGPLIVGVGVGYLAAATSGGTWTLLALSCAALVVGALCWSWSTYLRGTHYREFALGQQAALPFRSYVLLTIGGLALLGVALLTGDFPAWLAWLTLGADLLFLAGYLRFGDIPPFVFYVLLTVVGIAVL